MVQSLSATPPAPPRVGSRYVLHERIGEGGMGVVYRATDRLTGQIVALKRVSLPETPSPAATSSTAQSNGLDFRRSLAAEFRTLASLRHPNIISVYNYGFDEERQPYYTMDWLDHARTIIEAARDQPRDEQVRLIVQLLQALDYLHRRGVVHRDLKPHNVLVVGKQVRVLDFGLADVHIGPDGDLAFAGSVAYTAPEVLRGEESTAAADLFAVGIIAYEMFAGYHPFDSPTTAGMMSAIIAAEPDIDSLGLADNLAAALRQLLAKSPTERVASARDLIVAYAEATGRDDLYEVRASPESFIGSSAFVGRDGEFHRLARALDAAREGQGSLWLVGGEAGVGKSRLLDELRIHALVEGVQVLRDHAVREDTSPYCAWREPIRCQVLENALDGTLTPLEASILKPLIPDIETLIDCPVDDPPELDPQTFQERLLSVIEALVRRHTRPVLILVEDLQWSGEESLVLFERLAGPVSHLPILLVGSFWEDERPDLPDRLHSARLLRLERLPRGAITALCRSMLGSNGVQPELIDLLMRETGGNPSYAVEIVRALVEEVGQARLAEAGEIDRAALPEAIASLGIDALFERRLARVPEWARELLETAALAGRQVDLALLRATAPEADLDEFLLVCADAAVLEVRDGQWSFVHERLRMALIDSLSTTG